ncbi:MAG: hypothetical protein BAJALOKI1v1_220011 [Promethearchaeota archaeon]|nr:MAG: hypothetical protein BAJALOKI1v1_220011 [Candidatus Lokiarchaeota archaeon]
MTIKKEIILSTRVDKNLLKQLDIFSKKYNQSKSKILRNALQYYIRFAQKDNLTKVPYIIFTKREFQELIDKLTIDDLRNLAEHSYESAKLIRKDFVKQFFQTENEVAIFLKPRSMMTSLQHFLFDYTGQNWMSSIKQYFHKKYYYFSGKHVFNKNFSIYITYFLDKFMDEYKYDLIDSTLREKFIYLVYRQRD